MYSSLFLTFPSTIKPALKVLLRYYYILHIPESIPALHESQINENLAEVATRRVTPIESKNRILIVVIFLENESFYHIVCKLIMMKDESC
jgi:hypothetical protein